MTRAAHSTYKNTDRPPRPHLMLVLVLLVLHRRRGLLKELRPPHRLLRPRKFREDVDGRGEVEGHGGGARGAEE